jgi:hypothetical protein
MEDIDNAKPDTAAHPADQEFKAQDSCDENSAMPADCLLVIQPDNLLPGDVLLYRSRAPNLVQKAISSATDGPYTHAAICLGNGPIAESVVPNGVVKSDLKKSLCGSQCVAVFRSQCGFDGTRPGKLNEFVASVLKQSRFYDFSAVLNFGRESKAYFENQLEFVSENYGKAATAEEFAARSFFCSAFVVACYSAVGIIDESAQVAYRDTLTFASRAVSRLVRTRYARIPIR